MAPSSSEILADARHTIAKNKGERRHARICNKRWECQRFRVGLQFQINVSSVFHEKWLLFQMIFTVMEVIPDVRCSHRKKHIYQYCITELSFMNEKL